MQQRECALWSLGYNHTQGIKKKKGHSTLLAWINKLSGCLFFVFKETILPFFHTRLLHCRAVCYSATNTLGKFISWLNFQETCFICASICSFIYNVAKPMSAQCDFCTADWPASLQRGLLSSFSYSSHSLRNYSTIILKSLCIKTGMYILPKILSWTIKLWDNFFKSVICICSRYPFLCCVVLHYSYDYFIIDASSPQISGWSILNNVCLKMNIQS